MFGQTQAAYLSSVADASDHLDDTIYLDMADDLALSLKHKNEASKS
jgi:hypothetical protein